MRTDVAIVAAGAGLLALLAWRASKAVSGVAGEAWDTATAGVGYAWDTASGLATGDNALVHNATNADGQRVDAYEGWGAAGTLGAATNAASGGWFSTFGEYLGGFFYRGLHPETETAPTARVPVPQTGGASGTW